MKKGGARQTRRRAASTPKGARPRATKRSGLTSEVECHAFAMFSDASGAAAKLSFRGHAFLFNLPGEVRCNLVGAPPGGTSKVQARVAQLACTIAFMTMLYEAADADWLERNVRTHVK